MRDTEDIKNNNNIRETKNISIRDTKDASNTKDSKDLRNTKIR